MVSQNEIEGWSEQDEEQFQALLKKRLSLRRGTKGHDIKFAEDLVRGENGERKLVSALLKGEVKTIYEVSRNGKLFIEHESYGKPSGIETTDADYWIFLLEGAQYKGEVFVGISTERLRKLVAPLSFDKPCGQHKASIGKRLNLPEILLPNMRII